MLKRLIRVIVIIASVFSLKAEDLEKIALSKIDSLEKIIVELEKQGIDVQKEKLTVRTAEVFLFYANWDEANVSKNTEYFTKFWVYKDDASKLATDLADFERSDVIKMLDEGITYAWRLLKGEVFRSESAKIDWNQVSHDGDQLTHDGRPVFLADYTWKPTKAGSLDLTEFYGDKDGYFISPTHVKDQNGTINSNIVSELNKKGEGRPWFIFINNSNVPSWTTTKYGADFTENIGGPFTNYDIDHPGAKEMMGYLLDGTVKKMAGKNYTNFGYMLCNEPRWINYKNGTKKVWYNSGVSEYTMTKFRSWLSIKHDTISALNNLWGTSFENFDSVTLDIPIDIALQGTPQWYDYNAFNDNRVLEWFTWMKAKLRENDPDAKAHLKIMPSFFTDNDPCTGIDLEALTELSEINGNDCAAQYNATSGTPEWSNHYILGWRELYMGYDFLKSVQPDQINFNTEGHFLSTGHTRDLYMDPAFVRAVYWASHTLGLNVSQTWYWPRRSDGSIRTPVSNGYAGSNNQQPRVTNELHTTMMDLNRYPNEIMAMQRQRKPIRIFYSKTAAFQKGKYMDDLFGLYESLNFEGVSLGFATKNIISRHEKSNWDVVLVYKTEHVTRAELDTLQAYLNNGGTIIMDEGSLKKNEYGKQLPALEKGNGELIVSGSLNEMKTAALSLLEVQGNMPEVSLIETNSGGHKGCTWKCIQNEAGNNVLSIVNLGKTKAKLKIQLKNASIGTKVIDLLDGIEIEDEISLKPYGVLLIEVKDEASDLSNAEIRTPKKKDFARLYPSLSKGDFTIDFFKTTSNVKLKAFAMDGSVVMQKSYGNVKQVQEHLFDHSNGLYFVQVHSNNETQMFRFLKQ